MRFLLLSFKTARGAFLQNKNPSSFWVALLLFGTLILAVSGEVTAGSGGAVSTDEIDIQTQGLKPNSCCLLKHDIRAEGRVFFEGQYVGAPVPYSSLKELACPENSGYTETPSWAGLCTLDGVMTFSEWLFWLTTILSVVAVVLGAFTITTAMGDTNRVKKGQKIIEFGVLGMVIAAASRMIPSVIRYFIGV